MIPTRLCVLLVTYTVLLGCSTAYAPEGEYGGFPHGGYTDSRTDANTDIIGFQGNPFTSPQQIRRYLMYRSAKVTLDAGYDYFIITSSSFSPRYTHILTEDTYNGYVSDPPQLHNVYCRTVNFKAYYSSHTAIKYRGIDQCNIGMNGSTAVIKMFKGRLPYGVPNAFYAKDVIARLGYETFGAVTY